MAYQTLQVQEDPRGILTVQLNRPDVRNAFNEIVIQELGAVFRLEATKPQIRAVVLQGKGSIFCAGGDLNWMRKAIDEDLAANYADTRALTELFSTMNECPKPMIGLIQGAAIGGGVGLVSVCDIVIASKETQFSLSEVRLGIVPACIGPFVIAKIGASRARELFLSAERFDATKAHTIGLVHQLVESPADLAVAGQKVLSNILQASPNAVTIAKRLVLDLSWPERMWQIPDTLEYVSKTLAEIRVTEQGQEGIKAFLEKRKPNWI